MRQIKKWFKLGEGGFTLIELLIVIAVLGALAAVVAPNVGRFMGSANTAAANSEVANVKTGTTAYLADYNTFPSTSENLTIAGGGATDYLSAAPKAKYTFATNSGLITRVDKVTDGWSNIVFDISDQKWIQGSDTSGNGDQDQP